MYKFGNSILMWHKMLKNNIFTPAFLHTSQQRLFGNEKTRFFMLLWNMLRKNPSPSTDILWNIFIVTQYRKNKYMYLTTWGIMLPYCVLFRTTFTMFMPLEEMIEGNPVLHMQNLICICGIIQILFECDNTDIPRHSATTATTTMYLMMKESHVVGCHGRRWDVQIHFFSWHIVLFQYNFAIFQHKVVLLIYF